MLFVDGGNDKVGINTDAPESILHIKKAASGSSYSADSADLVIIENDSSAAIDIRTPTGDSGAIQFSDTTRARGAIIYYHSLDDMYFNVEGTSGAMVLNGNGLGIGQTSTDHKLTVNASAFDGIQLQSGGSDCGYLGVNTDTVYVGAGSNLIFHTGNAGLTNGTERMRIDSSGNIGFNTTNLAIGSSGGTTGNSTATPNRFMFNNNYSNGFTDASLKLYLFNENATRQGFTSGPAFDLQYHSSGSDAGRHAFYVANTESMRINKTSVNIVGSLSKGSGSFKIDHPLESKKDTHHLVHSFVEAPQADNIYRGVVQLANGTATINLDTVSGMTEGTFVSLNTNTSCFTSNETDWDSVKGSISGNILTINCQNTSSTANVTWLVIGERHDQHMLDNDWTDDNGKVIVEPLKEETYKLNLEGE
jgi:hypothetical protein